MRSISARAWFISARATLAVLALSSAASDFRPDERLILFPTLGYPSSGNSDWHIEIHAWAYEPETRPVLLPLFRKAMGLEAYDLSPSEKSTFGERALLFLADNERNKSISIRLGSKIYPVGRTGPNGHLRGRSRVPASEVLSLRQSMSAGASSVRFQAVSGRDERVIAVGELFLCEMRMHQSMVEGRWVGDSLIGG